jgi:hypothetical protein
VEFLVRCGMKIPLPSRGRAYDRIDPETVSWRKK